MGRVPRPVAERLVPLAPGFGARVEVAARVIGEFVAAAAAIGLSYDQLRQIITEKSVPSFPAIAALARRSGCTFSWLAFGEPPQFRAGRESTSAREDTRAVNYSDPETVLIRRYDVAFSAGPGAAVGEEVVTASIPFSRRYLEVALRAAPDDVAMGQADGDSMLPTIADKDLLMVHLGRRRIADGKIFVLRLGNELVVKRVQREIDGSLLLISDNKAYPERRLTQAEADQVDVIGRLIWSGGPI